jgi:glycosyltransferase involved in cell wall biosynthesis
MRPPIHILAYNNARYTLDSIRRFREWSPKHELHLWDNGSDERNRAGLVALERDATIHYLDPDPAAHRNKKIGGARNAQLDHAREAGEKWVLQADNDTFMLSGWWEKMQGYIESFPQVALWGFYLCSNHRVLWREQQDGRVMRIPSLLSGCIWLIDTERAEEHGVRYPEDPVDYSGDPFWKDMGGFTGVDISVQRQFEAADLVAALPEEDLAVHMAQPGRYGGYK